jgi:hypothetical protein
MMRPVDLISPAYRDRQRELHAQPRGYGQKGSKWAPTVRWLLEHYAATSVLDYGCGQGSLARALREYQIPGLRIAEYDPAIPGKDLLPLFADLVVCTDVLEHIEPERLPIVLAHLKLLARKAVFLVVNLRPAGKWLSDGRNAHLIVESADWWQRVVTEAGLTIPNLPEIPNITALQNPAKAAKCWVAVVTP